MNYMTEELSERQKNPKEKVMFRRILICLDGSSLSEQVLPYAIEQAVHFKSQLVLLRIIMPLTATPAVAGPITEGMVEKEAEAKKAAEAYLVKLAQKLSREKKLKVESLVLEGLVAETIIEYAHDRNNKIDLIAIATHGKGGLKRFVFGSVADFVLRHSDVPMLLVRPQVQPPKT
jgi:nucleotide-binding universal stress UspA family protein